VLDGLAHPTEGLAAALGAAGRVELAEAVRHGLFVESSGPPAGLRPAEPRPCSPALVERLSQLFVGREGRCALLLPDHRGHQRLQPLDRSLEREDWEGHLAGRRLCGFYPVARDGTLRLAAVTFLLARDAQAQLEQGSTLDAQLIDAAARLARAAGRHELPCLVEASGQRERRVWLLFAEPLPQRDVRALVVKLLDETGALVLPVRAEPMPATDKVREGPGPLLTLPLAGRPFKGAPAKLLLPGGRPVDDPEELLQQFVPIPKTRVHELVRRGPLLAATPQRGSDPLAELLRDLPRPLRIAKGCAVVAALIRKALDIGYLETLERRSLIELLGHGPIQGREALLRIFERCGQRDPRELDRSLARLPEMPISCGRLRERHAALLQGERCGCSFPGLRGGGYPTPLLQTFRPEEISAFRRAPPGERTPARPATTASGPTLARRPPSAAPPSPVVLSSHQAVAPASPRAVVSSPPPGSVPAPPPPAAPLPAAPRPPSAGAPAGAPADPLLDLRRLAAKLRQQREQVAALQAATSRTELRLAELLARGGLHQAELEGLRLTVRLVEGSRPLLRVERVQDPSAGGTLPPRRKEPSR